MPEIQNNFIQSKMNQDVDDRLVPNGEYRAALNVAISRSEGSDVGALENILGNSEISVTNLTGLRINNLDIVGYYIDRSEDNIYVFLSDYVDSSSSGLANFAPSTVNNFIYRYNNTSGLYTKLAQGHYLNFSKNSPILSVNILEGLMFWTDNRNQPRKINVRTAVANSNYYNSEDKISLAKYYPYTPINLVDLAGDEYGVSTMTNPSQEFLDIEKDGEFYDNPDYEEDWAGDPELLSDKFVRFSYRFKFDDGEYSLMAPWTQICFIPKQQGYFNTLDSEEAYRSTVVSFMENNVTQMLLNITFPTQTPNIDLSVSSVDILYKESDGLAIKVIESIPIDSIVSQMANNANNLVYSYKYISTKPYKTLPSSDATRVYDTVPVRALSQEIISNRVVYGNFFDKQTPPKFINYGVGYGLKDAVTSTPVQKIYSQIEYPSSSLKQNRNYQVGFVLADRFGRQSSVILSAKDSGTTSEDLLFGGSTVYVPYADDSIDALTFPGYELKVLVDIIEGGTTAIPITPNISTGYPGVYKDNSQGVDSAIITTPGVNYSPGQNIATTGGSGSGCTVDITVNASSEINAVTINNPGTGYKTGETLIPSGIGGGGASFLITVNEPNPLGWYSYKIVIKQTEQEYYNVYLPGILNGYPIGSKQNPDGNGTEEENKTANIVLYSDNINKIPKDLNEVGPDQRQYRSSVNIFGRVTPNFILPQNNVFSTQSYPSALSDTVPSIATLRDTNYNPIVNKPGEAADLDYREFYQSDTNPSIARISIKNQIGKTSLITTPTELNYGISLGVYETSPVTSLLDIYWETSTVGLVSELNKAASADFSGPNEIIFDLPYTHEEGTPDTTIVAQGKAIDDQGNEFVSGQIEYTLMSVEDANGDAVSQWTSGYQTRSGLDCFDLQSTLDGFELSISEDTFFYFSTEPAKNNFKFYIDCFDNFTSSTTTLQFEGALSNTPPEITTTEISVTYDIGEAPSLRPIVGVPNIVFKMDGYNGVYGAAATDQLKRDGLSWSLGDVSRDGTTSPDNFGFSIDPVSGVVSHQGANISSGETYNLPITLTDSGEDTDSTTLTVNIKGGEFITFYSKSDTTGTVPPSETRKIYNTKFNWRDSENNTQEILLVTDTTPNNGFTNVEETATVSPIPNNNLEAIVQFTMTDTKDNCYIYIYKGDVGSWSPTTGGAAPPDEDLIWERKIFGGRQSPFSETFEIPNSYQSDATAFTIFVWIHDLANNQTP